MRLVQRNSVQRRLFLPLWRALDSHLLVRRFLPLLVLGFFIVNNCLLHKTSTKTFDLQESNSSLTDRTVYKAKLRQQHSRSSSNNNNTTYFAATRFTKHVKQVVELYDFDGIEKCDNEFIFSVNDDSHIPTLSCILNPLGKGVNPVSSWWCKVLNKVFAPENHRTLPYNVSFGISTMDFLDHVDMYSCIGSSAYEGNFSMMNFQEIERMKNNEEFVGLPWEQRKTIPIWRGTPWVPFDELDFDHEETLYEQVLSVSPRLKAVDFSLRNPSLLNARVHQKMEEMEYDNATVWRKDSPTGLYKLLKRPHYIPEEVYYIENQVTLVLCGLGASFRTSVFLSTATAVVLQECDYKEWFTPLMKEWHHYIPLSRDLVDLEDKMKWIQDNPEQVKKIANKGHAFYNRLLSFSRNEEHIYEFVYRLSLAKQEYDKTLTPKELQKLQSRSAHHQETEIISINDGRIGNVEELETMCHELLTRAQDFEYGQEPWKDSAGGLKWIMNDCADQPDSVLGNHLSRWYMIRAVAADAGISVEMPCSSPVLDRLETDVSPYDTPLDGAFKFSWKDYCRGCEQNDEACRYPHVVRANGLERIRTVIQHDMRSMAYKVIMEHPQIIKELDDATIHLRCGDIGRQDHTLYGLVPFRVYKELIPENATSIGIVTAPFKQDREGWGPGDPELNEAVAIAARTYLQKAFPNATVTIRNSDKESLDIVMTRLIMTNTSICGPSTFCVFPAMSALKESYIMHSPLFGGHPTWLNRVARAFKNVHYVNKRYFPSIDLYKLSTRDIVHKLKGTRRRDL